MKEKFFVTITASNREKFLTLHTYEMDLIVPTSKIGKRTSTIDALLTQEDIEKLVKAGFSVKVKEEASKKSRAHEEVTENFQDWLRDMKERKELA